jgi:hypothetical protein
LFKLERKKESVYLKRDDSSAVVVSSAVFVAFPLKFCAIDVDVLVVIAVMVWGAVGVAAGVANEGKSLGWGVERSPGVSVGKRKGLTVLGVCTGSLKIVGF